jgi:hypothetical protein
MAVENGSTTSRHAERNNVVDAQSVLGEKAELVPLVDHQPPFVPLAPVNSNWPALVRTLHWRAAVRRCAGFCWRYDGH